MKYILHLSNSSIFDLLEHLDPHKLGENITYTTQDEYFVDIKHNKKSITITGEWRYPAETTEKLLHKVLGYINRVIYLKENYYNQGSRHPSETERIEDEVEEIRHEVYTLLNEIAERTTLRYVSRKINERLEQKQDECYINGWKTTMTEHVFHHYRIPASITTLRHLIEDLLYKLRRRYAASVNGETSQPKNM